MTDLFDRVAAIPGGRGALAAARLRDNVLDVLRRCLASSRLTQVELARHLGVRKSAVNNVFQGDGNVQINTLAEYLAEMGAELRIEVVPFGTQRQEIVAHLNALAPHHGSSWRSVYMSYESASHWLTGPAATENPVWHSNEAHRPAVWEATVIGGRAQTTSSSGVVTLVDA